MFEYALVFVYKKSQFVYRKLHCILLLEKKIKIGKSHQLQQKHAVVKITWQQQPGKFRESHHDDQCCNEQIIID